MKLRVYMNDWSINMGIVGFLNIINNTEYIDEIKNSKSYKKENYIEFDSSILENFHEYYFKYFMNEYDVSKRIENSINYNLSYLKKNEDKIKDIANIHVPAPSHNVSKASSLCSIAIEKYNNNIDVYDCYSINPLYIRKSQAEVQYDEKMKRLNDGK